MNARYYVPTLNRFASADTIVPDPMNPQQFNRYSYVLNSPLNFIDPTGHFCTEVGGNTICSQDPDPLLDYLDGINRRTCQSDRSHILNMEFGDARWLELHAVENLWDSIMAQGFNAAADSISDMFFDGLGFGIDGMAQFNDWAAGGTPSGAIFFDVWGGLFDIGDGLVDMVVLGARYDAITLAYFDETNRNNITDEQLWYLLLRASAELEISIYGAMAGPIAPGKLAVALGVSELSIDFSGEGVNERLAKMYAGSMFVAMDNPLAKFNYLNTCRLKSCISAKGMTWALTNMERINP